MKLLNGKDGEKDVGEVWSLCCLPSSHCYHEALSVLTAALSPSGEHLVSSLEKNLRVGTAPLVMSLIGPLCSHYSPH